MTFTANRWSTKARTEEEAAMCEVTHGGFETESEAIDELHKMIRKEIEGFQNDRVPNEHCIARLYAILYDLKYGENDFERGVRVEVGGLAFGVYGRDTRS